MPTSKFNCESDPPSSSPAPLSPPSLTMSPFNPSTSALVVIDMQNDFCPPTGSLAVPQGRDIIPEINNLLHLPFTLKIASRDHHPPDHISFVTSHPGKQVFEKVMTTHPDVPGKQLEQTLWPIHCVQNTQGAEFVDNLNVDEIDVHILKGQEKLVESYSAFIDPWGLFPSKLEQSLTDAGVTGVFIVGLAEDYCVKCTALDARERGFRTVIVEDCTRGVAPDTTESARKELKVGGVEYMHSSEVKRLFQSAGKDDGGE